MPCDTAAEAVLTIGDAGGTVPASAVLRGRAASVRGPMTMMENWTMRRISQTGGMLNGAALMLAAALLLASAGLTAASARDDDDGDLLDAIVLNLSAEGWAETDRATVHASIDAAFSGTQGQDMRSTALGALETLAPGADWKLTQFAQVRDSAGLDRWQIVAETRLKQDALQGLRDRAEAVSKPGMKVNVDHIDFSPVLADRERLRTELRQQVYAAAAAELKQLQSTFPGQHFTLGQINFAPESVAPVLQRAKAMPAQAMMMSEAADSGGGMNVSDRIVVRALVFVRTGSPDSEDED
ncbi:MAG: hypothetical protein RIB84_27620 [Sneathiellaceae bacterium]